MRQIQPIATVCFELVANEIEAAVIPDLTAALNRRRLKLEHTYILCLQYIFPTEINSQPKMCNVFLKMLHAFTLNGIIPIFKCKHALMHIYSYVPFPFLKFLYQNFYFHY